MADAGDDPQEVHSVTQRTLRGCDVRCRSSMPKMPQYAEFRSRLRAACASTHPSSPAPAARRLPGNEQSESRAAPLRSVGLDCAANPLHPRVIKAAYLLVDRLERRPIRCQLTVLPPPEQQILSV